MPLVQYTTCSQCDRLTWHEFVDDGVRDCAWVCRECGDRRTTRRVTLSPQCALHRAKLQTDTLAREVMVLDLSVLGARLEIDDESPMPCRGDMVLFNPKLQPVGPLGDFHRAKVRWVQGSECGVAFERAIFASASDLRRIVK